MHEFSIASDMLKIVEDQLGGKQALISATVTIGPLSGVNPESLRFCFTELAEMEGFGRPELAVNEVPARIQCRACGQEYETRDLFELCPRCGELDRIILSGEEFTLDKVEIEEE
ncbi:MAG: hydrogenase maturation nickel metallochaperone HypA [Planctomycetes bacterium]|nr:hydrogenase maturation nickel metallochaperone HypA [Planctomycetota bacterium]